MYAADCGFIRKNGDPMTKITKSADETEALGAYIASLLDKKTSFVALYGEMGAGKTAFVRGFASVISPGSRVKSPTYTVVNEYRRGEIPLFHFDLYRLSSPEELDSLGFDEYVSSGICIAEWPDMLGDDLPENAVRCTSAASGKTNARSRRRESRISPTRTAATPGDEKER